MHEPMHRCTIRNFSGPGSLMIISIPQVLVTHTMACAQEELHAKRRRSFKQSAPLEEKIQLGTKLALR